MPRRHPAYARVRAVVANCAVFRRVISLMSRRPVPKMARQVPWDVPARHFPWSTTQMNEASEQTEGCALPLLAAADLQDHLMTATNDLERLQSLFADACDTLSKSFYGASEQIRVLMDAPDAT